MESKYTVEWLLKASIDELKNFFASSSIADVIGIIESINAFDDMDYLSKMQIDTIDRHLSDERLRLEACDRRIDFATKTNAPAGEISELWTEYEAIDNRIDSFNSQKETIKQNFADKKNAVINLARNTIANAPASLIETHRLEVISYIQDKINSIEKGKNNKEITVDTLTSEPEGFTKEDIEAKSIGEEIARLEEEVNSGRIPLTDTLTSKIRAMRKKKESLEETTFTHVCTEKIKLSLKGLSNNITELQLELYSLLNLSTEEYRTRLVNRFNEESEYIRVCNSIRIYRSYVENLSNVPIDIKKDYRLVCAKYNNILEYLQNPQINGVSLSNINEEINSLMKKIARLETYKKALVDTSKEEKYLYPTVRNNGLFTLPFNEEKWHEYFGKLYEEVSPSLDRVRDINTKYTSLINNPVKSSDISQRISDYKVTLEDLLNDLYNRILSLYFKKNCLINVNIYDYRSREGFAKYVEYRRTSIDMALTTLKEKLSMYNKDKTNLLNAIESKFSEIENLKKELNAILKGEVKKELVVQEEKEDTVENPIPQYLEDLVNPSSFSRDTTSILDEVEDSPKEEVEEPVVDKKEEETEGFNPNDIFGSIEVPEKKEEPVREPIEVSFKPDEDIFDNVSAISAESFKELLEPKIEDVTPILPIEEPKEEASKRGIKVVKMEEVAKEEKKPSDAEEIAARIKEGMSKQKVSHTPASSADVLPEYSDSSAPINLSELSKPEMTTTEDIDLMSLLEQIETNDDIRRAM